MIKLNPNKVGLVFGAVFGLNHLIWSLLVWLGLAQRLLDFIFGLHMIESPFKLLPFSPRHAVTLVIFTTVIGYLVGLVFAWLWNWLHQAV